MNMHPNLAHLEPLFGVWKGKGDGFYPTIKDFIYDDELTFANVGKPFLAFTQRTWMDDQPRHGETGYLRAPSPDSIEFIVSLPTGHTELGVGTCEISDDGEIHIRTMADVQTAPTAKEVTKVMRDIRVKGGEMRYELAMAAVGQPMSGHLLSFLRRVS